MEISGKLKEERRRFDLTQEELAEQIGVTERTIGSWESGETSPNLSDAIKLKNLFNVTLDYLIKDSIASKNEAEEYTKLGRDVSRVIHFTGIGSIFKRYAICEKETYILIPRTIVRDVMEIATKQQKELGRNLSNDEAAETIEIALQVFLFNWHKLSKANALISKETTKRELLIELEKIFTTSCAVTDLQKCGRQYPEKSVLFLRDQLIKQIETEYGLDEYRTKVSDLEMVEQINSMKRDIVERDGKINVSLSKYS